MAQGGAYHHGEMDITDQKQVFHGFLVASLWTSALIAQSVMLLTLAFAIGAGWWPGLAAFVAIGVGIGLLFKMNSVYWAVQAVLLVLLGLGGLIVPALAGMIG
ncbi:MAG: aa3-type cytochrome c oxidase subunit IV [Hyphomonadaceae bacterium]|nr:aa3-type cytochrome c oxidase subunit IV [Hyphomonadaceae bacterium]